MRLIKNHCTNSHITETAQRITDARTHKTFMKQVDFRHYQRGLHGGLTGEVLERLSRGRKKIGKRARRAKQLEAARKAK